MNIEMSLAKFRNKPKRAPALNMNLNITHRITHQMRLKV